MPRPDIYISTDVEADGPIPGPFSMRSLGMAAFRLDLPGEEPVSTFEANLEPLEGAGEDAATMEWWGTQQVAWDYCNQNRIPPAEAMARALAWVQGFNLRPTFVCYPTFDQCFVHWYFMRFCNVDPFGFSAYDMKTLVAEKLNLAFRDVNKSIMPMEWFDTSRPHTHRAIDDAIEQGVMFLRMKRWGVPAWDSAWTDGKGRKQVSGRKPR